MSSSLPPGGPPSDGAEYLDIGSGGPLRPSPDDSTGGGRRAVLVAAAVGGLVLVGAGAWAAWSFFATGPQPAEALPDSTLAYASIDLDPSGGQKIAALRTLQKFPAFEDEIGLDTDDDIRQWIFEQAQDSGACPDLDYADDVEPWLGDRFAVAAVDTGGDFPDPVFVVQVGDEDAADTGLTKLRDCADGEGAWAIADGWALVGETQEIVDDVAADAADSPLSEDDDFTHWTGEAGDAGIATMYVAPEAGELLADQVDELLGFGGLGEVVEGSAAGFAESAAYTDDTDELTDALKDFKGAAATLRFDDGSLELELAGDPGKAGLAGSGAAGDLVGSLPEDSAFAIGVGLADGWFGDVIDDSDLLQMLEEQSGLDLPDDAETLAGEAAAVSVGGDFDPELFFDSADGSDVPVGLKVRGDAAAIEDVLDKLRSGGGEPVLDSDSDGDLVAIGPNADYRAQLLEDGGLGGSELFRDAVPDADGAAAIVFVSFDAGDWLDHLAESDPEMAENLRPLAGLGMSARVDGDTSHLVLRVTTD